uniref:Coat protein n=1 Tax=Grapevine Kizil Sapak virus TaxID=2650001 RepID=A0A5P2YB07_9VIRU|nr:coat protein [Grapevine Kizil Sapak virus]
MSSTMVEEVSAQAFVRNAHKQTVRSALKQLDAFKAMKEEDEPAVFRALAGNIAIYGCSTECDFPNVPISAIKAGKVVLTFNLLEAARTISEIPQNWLGEPTIRPTFRQCMEPFADHARLYLMEAKKRGTFTHLYDKMPKLCRGAPQVAFDFNAGLNFNTVSNGEKYVIQKLNERLFALESAKKKEESFLDQGGEVNPV